MGRPNRQKDDKDKGKGPKEQQVSDSVHVKRVGKRIQVQVPFDQVFINGAKELSARWRPRSRVWSFPFACYRLVGLLIGRVYGQDNVPPWMQL